MYSISRGILDHYNYFLFRNVIDVAALDSHNLQQHEYVERVKHYNAKAQQVCAAKKSRLTQKLRNCILEDIASPDRVLHSESLSHDDRNMVGVQ